MSNANINLFSIKKGLSREQRLATIKKALIKLGFKYKPTKSEEVSNREEFDQAINGLVRGFLPIVKSIEASIEMTPNHSDQYLNVITCSKDQSFNTRVVIATALIKAGANEQGVECAMNSLGIYKKEVCDEKEI